MSTFITIFLERHVCAADDMYRMFTGSLYVTGRHLDKIQFFFPEDVFIVVLCSNGILIQDPFYGRLIRRVQNISHLVALLTPFFMRCVFFSIYMYV